MAARKPIKSDDPNAVALLQAKLDRLQKIQDGYKAVNAAHKAFLKDPATLDAALFADGTPFSDKTKDSVRNYVPRYSWEPHPIAPFYITNNGAEINRVKKRIASLTQAA